MQKEPHYKCIILLTTFWLLHSIFAHSAFAQVQFYLKGQILDVRTRKPVPFATISFTNNYYGVISNEDGSFSLPYSNLDSGLTVLIRSVGYEKMIRKLTELDLQTLQFFYLNPISYEIKEVVVNKKKQRKKSAVEIVRLAVNSIESNYPVHPFLLMGYYREYLKINENYLNLFEATVDVEDRGFNTDDDNTTRIEMLYGAINKSFPFDPNKITDYGNNKRIPYGNTGYNGGNEFYFLLSHNPVRNYRIKSFDFIRYIQTDFPNDHIFKITGIEYIDDIPYYRIEFKYVEWTDDMKFPTGNVQTAMKSESSKKNYRATGYIYIQAITHVISRLNYQVSYNDRGKPLKLWELNLEYRDREGTPYLNYLSFNNIIEISKTDNKEFFYLKEILIDKAKGMVKLHFNNKVDPISARNIRNYRLVYAGRRLNINTAMVADTCVNLVVVDFYKTLGFYEQGDAALFSVDVKNCKDVYGNEVNVSKQTMHAYQYREFFVNDVKLDFQPIPEKRCMDIMKSIVKTKGGSEKIPDGIFFNSPLIDKTN